MLTVYNVGQGDALLIQPQPGCTFNNPPLLVDVGPKRAKLGQKLTDNRLAVLLTHSHEDHIGGLPDIIEHRANRIERLILPYYLPEVISIFEFIRKYTTVKIGNLDWFEINALPVQLVCDGDQLCNHIEVLNPPIDSYSCFTDYPTNERGIQEALGVLREAGMELPVENIQNYKSPLNADNIHVEIRHDQHRYNDVARTFVHNFFITLSTRVPMTKDGDGLTYFVDSHMKMAANHASVVFRYDSHETGSWLFTGDADEAVFERLISSNRDISAYYLKVPHHGSRENLTLNILNAISPEVAVISHGNKRFGRSLDPHPHHEVIDLLDRKRVRSYYTNDVIKDGEIVKRRANQVEENSMIYFC